MIGWPSRILWAVLTYVPGTKARTAYREACAEAKSSLELIRSVVGSDAIEMPTLSRDPLTCAATLSILAAILADLQQSHQTPFMAQRDKAWLS